MAFKKMKNKDFKSKYGNNIYRLGQAWKWKRDIGNERDGAFTVEYTHDDDPLTYQFLVDSAGYIQEVRSE